MSVETAPPSAELGTVGERYRLLQRLVAPTDTGPAVWRGRDTVLNRQVTVTVCAPDDPTGQLLMKHAHALSMVEHPSLPRVFDAAAEGGLAWVVTEWVEGSTLASALADGPFDARAAATSVAKLADGVARAHRAGLTVGLLDPDHVVITPRGTVTVTRLAVAGDGTSYDDVRMLGALLYAALTGGWPTHGGSQAAGSGQMPSPRQVRAGVPAELSAIAMRALNPHHSDPLVDAAALAEALGSWHRSAEPEPFALELPVEERYVEGRRRRRRWVPLAAFATGLCAIALAGVLVTNVLNRASTDTPSSSPVASEPPQSVVAPGPVSVLSTTMYDPAGDGQENPRDAHLAHDGDPTTVWSTLQYRRNAEFGNLKPGVGLIFDLGHPARVSAVTIQTTKPGADLQIRVGDEPDGPVDSYRVVGQASQIGVSTTISLPAGTTGRYFVVWITKLVPVGGSLFQADLAEVHFLP